MATKYVVLSAEEMKKAVPAYNPQKLGEFISKALARKLKSDKKYTANIDDDTMTVTLVLQIEDGIVAVLKKLKDHPRALEVYTDTSWFSSESNLLMKLECDGPLNGKPQKLEVDWKQVKGDLKAAGKIADREAKIGMKRWVVLSHPDLWPKVAAKLGKDAAAAFEIKALPVEVEIADLAVLEQLSANANPLLLQKVKDKADFNGLVADIAEVFQSAYEEGKKDPKKAGSLESRVKGEVEELLQASAMAATEEILASVRVKADRKKYIVTSTFKLVMTFVSVGLGLGSLLGSGLTGGLSGIYAVVQLIQSVASTIGQLRALAQDSEEVQKEYLEAVEKVRSMYEDASRARVGLQETGSEIASALAFTENTLPSISTCRRLLDRWEAKNNGLLTNAEAASASLEKALNQTEKVRKDLKKFEKELNDTSGEVPRDLYKKAAAMITLLDDLEKKIDTMIEQVITLHEHAQEAVGALEAESKAFEPLKEKQPAWSRIATAVALIGKSVQGLSQSSLDSTLDTLSTITGVVGTATDLKDGVEEIRDALKKN